MLKLRLNSDDKLASGKTYPVNYVCLLPVTVSEAAFGMLGLRPACLGAIFVNIIIIQQSGIIARSLCRSRLLS